MMEALHMQKGSFAADSEEEKSIERFRGEEGSFSPWGPRRAGGGMTGRLHSEEKNETGVSKKTH